MVRTINGNEETLSADEINKIRAMKHKIEPERH